MDTGIKHTHMNINMCIGLRTDVVNVHAHRVQREEVIVQLRKEHLMQYNTAHMHVHVNVPYERPLSHVEIQAL